MAEAQSNVHRRRRDLPIESQAGECLISAGITDKTTSKVGPWKVLLYTCAAVFIVTLDATILFVAFPAIRASYPHVSPANLSWVLNAYTIVVGAMLVPAGAYADKFGRKKTFLLGVPIFTVGSLLCGISQGVWFLIAARAL